MIQRIPACRYDDAEWSDCDPFEMIRFRTMRLISGGRQCDEIKNITKHCTADELPPGTKWLIAEHRKCIAELKRLDRAIKGQLISKWFLGSFPPKNKRANSTLLL